MSNLILRMGVQDRSLAPAQAEVWITVVPARLDAGTEIRGRLLGPRCTWAGTVQVAYPLRPLQPGVSLAGEGLTRRVVIPEASLWEPESPFLYEGPIELWQDGVCCDRATLRHGLRAITFGPRGLRVNGKPLDLSGRVVARSLDESAAQALRQEGCNLLVTDVAAEEVWEAADRLGFFVLGRVPGGTDDILRRAINMARHPCSLGWLVPEGADFRGRLPQGLVGIDVPQRAGESLPGDIHFLHTPGDRS
jgi:hypothetical protein